MAADVVDAIADGKYYFRYAAAGGTCCYYVDPGGERTTPPWWLPSQYVLHALGTRYATCSEGCPSSSSSDTSSSSSGNPCAECCVKIRVRWNMGVFGGSGVFVQDHGNPCYWVGGDTKLGGTIRLAGSTWVMQVYGYTDAGDVTVGDSTTSGTSSTSDTPSGQYCYFSATAPYSADGVPPGISSSSSTAAQPCPLNVHWTVTGSSCGSGSVVTECDEPESVKIYWRGHACCFPTLPNISAYALGGQYYLKPAGDCIWATHDTVHLGSSTSGSSDYPLSSIAKGDQFDLDGEDGFPAVDPVAILYWVLIVRTYNANGSPNKKYRFQQADDGTGYPCGDKPWTYVDDSDANGVTAASAVTINDNGNPWHEIWFYYGGPPLGDGQGHGCLGKNLFLDKDGWCYSVLLDWDPLDCSPTGEWDYGDFIDLRPGDKIKKTEVPWHWLNNQPSTHTVVFEVDGFDCTCRVGQTSSSSSSGWHLAPLCPGQRLPSSSSGQTFDVYLPDSALPSKTSYFRDPYWNLCRTLSPKAPNVPLPNSSSSALIMSSVTDDFDDCYDCTGGKLAVVCDQPHKEQARTVWVPNGTGMPDAKTWFRYGTGNRVFCYSVDPSDDDSPRPSDAAIVSVTSQLGTYDSCETCICRSPSEELGIKAIFCGSLYGGTDQSVWVNAKHIPHTNTYFFAYGGCYLLIATTKPTVIPDGANVYDLSGDTYDDCLECYSQHSSSTSSGTSSSSGDGGGGGGGGGSSSSSSGGGCNKCYLLRYVGTDGQTYWVRIAVGNLSGGGAAQGTDLTEISVSLEGDEDGNWTMTVTYGLCVDTWVGTSSDDCPPGMWTLVDATCDGSVPQAAMNEADCDDSGGGGDGDSSSSAGGGECDGQCYTVNYFGSDGMDGTVVVSGGFSDGWTGSYGGVTVTVQNTPAGWFLTVCNDSTGCCDTWAGASEQNGCPPTEWNRTGPACGEEGGANPEMSFTASGCDQPSSSSSGDGGSSSSSGGDGTPGDDDMVCAQPTLETRYCENCVESVTLTPGSWACVRYGDIKDSIAGESDWPTDDSESFPCWNGDCDDGSADSGMISRTTWEVGIPCDSDADCNN